MAQVLPKLNESLLIHPSSFFFCFFLGGWGVSILFSAKLHVCHADDNLYYNNYYKLCFQEI